MSFLRIHEDQIKLIFHVMEQLLPPSVKTALALAEELKKLEPIAEDAMHVVEGVTNKHKQ